jgi:hypothetical protein
MNREKMAVRLLGGLGYRPDAVANGQLYGANRTILYEWICNSIAERNWSAWPSICPQLESNLQ